MEAEYSEAFLHGIALPLLKKWTDLYMQLGRRIIVFLAAPPAAGKSTMAAFLEALSKDREDVLPITAAGMDGFHRYQAYLTNHTMLRNGQETLMVTYKGAPETFDLAALKERLLQLRTEVECPWPVYDRRTHNPAEGHLTLKGNIILVEGNYLLLDWPGWRELKDLSDDTIMITAPKELLYDRLLERKLKTVPDREKAIRFVMESDLYNAGTILRHSLPAAHTLELLPDGDYVPISM